nr:12376_t:CDS:2 [Entrophospora candida]
MIQFAKDNDDDPNSLMDMTRRERLISEEIMIQLHEDKGNPQPRSYNDDEWIEKISILQENEYLCMSAITTLLIKNHDLTTKMNESELSKYTPEFLKNLTDDRKRDQGRRRLRDRYGFNDKQISILIPAQKGGRPKDLSEKDTNAECVKLVKTAMNENAGSSRLSRLRRELRILGASTAIIEATKIPEITRKANEIQKEQRQKAEDAGNIEYPDHFLIESVKERLGSYDIKTLPDIQALADVMIMLCIRPAELITLRIADTGVTGYAKNRDQQDIP